MNAWNEWAEGNHLEPDLKFGRAYLEAHRSTLQKFRVLNDATRRPPKNQFSEGSSSAELLRRLGNGPNYRRRGAPVKPGLGQAPPLQESGWGSIGWNPLEAPLDQ